jgi:hypothetical protein
MRIMCECETKDDTADGGSDGSGEKSGKTMFRFADTVVTTRRSLSDFIRDETAG